jgi:molecular chaperone DnaJ
MCVSTRFSSAMASTCSAKCRSVLRRGAGCELEVPTLDGRVKLKIPEGTQTGKQFRMRGKGVAPVRGGGAGDLMCRVWLRRRSTLSRRQRELMEEFRTTLEGDSSHSPKTAGWFEGVKRFFGDL